MSLPALVLAGFAASLGRSPRPVTARLTYSAKQAAQGGMIFAADAVSAEGEDAVRMSQALILTSGGLMSRGAAWARAHGAPAVVLPSARWEGGRLVVEEPLFGPEQRGGGLAFEPVSELKRRVIEEGEVVSVDATAGTVTAYPPQEQQRELELAQALEAYSGLRDGQALIHWWRAREEEPDAAALGLRLARELAARAVDGDGRAEDFGALTGAVESFLPASGRAAFREQADEAAAAQSRRGEKILRELRQDLMESSSEAAARSLSGRVDQLCRALEGLGARAAASCSAARASAQSRVRVLSTAPAMSWQQAAQAAGAQARTGAAIGADVYSRYVSQADVSSKIDDISSDASLSLALKAERIRRLFFSGRIPDAPAGAGPFDFSCEGASQENVAKADAPRALLECWAGFWSAGPLGRRKRAGVSGAAPRIEVFPSLAGEVSGVAYSRAPGAAARLFVSAGGDQYLLDRQGNALMAPVVSGEKAVLSPAQLKRLARVTRAVEGYFGEGVEVSFALSGEALYATSARASR